ncbi:hypothetical protein TNCV_2276701 [Trichonephila clavipes]|nr:hypothetical protein TNCV_2276701 [Trichonephila clavipes]
MNDLFRFDHFSSGNDSEKSSTAAYSLGRKEIRRPAVTRELITPPSGSQATMGGPSHSTKGLHLTRLLPPTSPYIWPHIALGLR